MKAAIGRRALRIGKWLLIAILLLIILAAVWFGWVLHATKPQLEGQVEAAGLSAPVSIARWLAERWLAEVTESARDRG